MRPENSFRLKTLFVILTVITTLGFVPGSFSLAHGQRAAASRQLGTALSVRQRGLLPSVTCGSGTNHWTGTAGDNEWTTATNWSSGAVPISTDNVCIASTFTSAITVGTLATTNQTIASLDSGAPLSLTAGPLTISGTATFADGLNLTGTLTLSSTGSMTTLTQSAGTLTNNATLTVSGLVTWSGGTISGTGTTNANGGMTLTVEPFLSAQTLNNAGTATWDGILFLMENGAVINNLAGATWNLENDSAIGFEGGTTPVFNNAGTFQKTGGTSSSGGGIGAEITFNNTGTVTDSSGTLFASNIGACSGTCGGSWSVVSGATLQLGSGATTAALSGPISGAGTVQFTTGTVNYTGTYNVTGGTQATNGTVNFTSPLTSVGPLNISGGALNFVTGKTITTTSLTQSGGTLEGTDTVTVSGMLTWSEGTESGTGTTNANGGMTLTVEPFLSGRTLNNAGTATWDGAVFLMENGAVINNLSGATWNIENDAPIQFEGGATPVFNNAGTFQKTSGTSSSGGGIGAEITFNNTGTVTDSSGVLFVSNIGVCSGKCAGSWSLASGTTLQLGSGATTAVVSGPISGAGTVQFTTGTVNYTGAYDVTGGTQATNGTVNFTSPATLTSVGPLVIGNGTFNFVTGKTITTSALTQSGGMLEGTDTVTVSGMLTWSQGTESGPGITNAEGGMTLTVEPFLSGRTLNNTKTATWDGDVFLMENGAVFNNKAGATWNHENDTSIQFEGGTTPVFNNAGTFEKTGGTTSTGGGFGAQVTVNNSGTMIAKSGILLLGSLFTQTGGSTLLEGGNIVTSGTATMTVNGGNVFGAGTITGALTNTSGLVSASPSVTSTTTGTLTVNGTNAGYYTQGSGGTVEFGVAGNSVGDFDVLTATGAATLAGSAQLCLVKGFKPTKGSTFQVMNYASETGNFSTVNFGWSLTPGTTSATATYEGAPQTSFAPSSLSFPSQLIGTASSQLTLTLTNTGTVSMSITGFSIAGTNASDFTISSNSCTSSLAAGGKCTVKVTFTPAALGSRSAALSVTDNACMSPQSIALSGKGTEITMSPSPVSFGSETIGTTSAPMTVTVTNHGTTAVKVTSTTITGTDKGDFAFTGNTCTTIAANNGTCSITLTFTPAASGARTASLSLIDNDKGSPQTDVLSGTGVN
jgi:hypothetical protein